jgi:hypothetical protein
MADQHYIKVIKRWKRIKVLYCFTKLKVREQPLKRKSFNIVHAGDRSKIKEVIDEVIKMFAVLYICYKRKYKLHYQIVHACCAIYNCI